MKTSELDGRLLDYWVAKAEGETPAPDPLRPGGFIIRNGWCLGSDYAPSTRWEQAGPIIDRERITLMGESASWYAEARFCKLASVHDLNECRQTGCALSPLVAAMRAYVASKFGEDLPDA